MLQLPTVVICLYIAIGLVFDSTARAQAANPAEALAAFSKQDNAGAWIKERNYMRDRQDETWKVRMRTLQSLVGMGEESIPPLLDALTNGDDETRVFAAQTLGYLAPNVPVPSKYSVVVAIQELTSFFMGLEARLEWTAFDSFRCKNERP